MNNIKELENKVIRLFEHKGIPAFIYNSIIKEIVKYVSANISKHSNSTIIIPKEICDKLEIFDDIEIKVNVYNLYDSERNTGSGTSTINSNIKLNSENKITNCKIKINSYSYNGILYTRTLTNSLYHELTHYYDLYKRLLNGQDSEFYTLKSITNYHYNTLKFSSKEQNTYIHNVFYRLFNKSEYKALIASVYPDLLEYGTVKSNWKNDMLKVQAYAIYQYIKNNISIIYELTDDDWQTLYKFCNIETNNSYGEFYIRSRNSLSSFKNNFIKKLKRKLSSLFKDIMHVASTYYENETLEKEDKEIKKMYEQMQGFWI